jgi:hypothetical protein
MEDIPVRILAIDPGDLHVGLADFVEDPTTDMGWACVTATETTRDGMRERLVKLIDQPNQYDSIVVERFTLYPDVAMSLTGKEMATSEMIGAIQFAATLAGVPVIRQPASWQQPTRGMLKHLKLKSTAKRMKAGPHAFSAELHGWAYLMRSGVTRIQVPESQQLHPDL